MIGFLSYKYLKVFMKDPDFDLEAFAARLKPEDKALLDKLLAEDQLLQDVEDFLFYEGCVITDVTVNGLVTFKASDHVHTHSNYTDINEETLRIELFAYDEDLDRFEESVVQFEVEPVKFEKDTFTV